MKQVSHQLSRKTLCWVGVLHLLLLLLFGFSGRFFQAESKDDFIPLIGLPDQLNPREGTPMIEGSHDGGGKADLPPGPKETIPQQTQPPPPPVHVPEPVQPETVKVLALNPPVRLATPMAERVRA